MPRLRKKVKDDRRLRRLADLRWPDLVFSPTLEYVMRHCELADFKDVDEVREVWSLLRDELLDAYPVAEGPMHGPSAWWWFDAPERVNLNGLDYHEAAKVKREALERWGQKASFTPVGQWK